MKIVRSDRFFNEKVLVICFLLGFIPIPMAHAESWIGFAGDATDPVFYIDSDSISRKGELVKVNAKIGLELASLEFDCVRQLVGISAPGSRFAEPLQAIKGQSTNNPFVKIMTRVCKRSYEFWK